MKFCENCGSKLDSDFKFCSSCGRSTSTSNVDSPDPELEVVVPYDNYELAQGFVHRHRRPMLIAGLILAVLLGVFLYNQNQSQVQITDCNSLSQQVIKLQTNERLIKVLAIYSPSEIPIPSSEDKPGWTTNLSCQGKAVNSTGAQITLDFQTVTDPNGTDFVQWQDASLVTP